MEAISVQLLMLHLGPVIERLATRDRGLDWKLARFLSFERQLMRTLIGAWIWPPFCGR